MAGGYLAMLARQCDEQVNFGGCSGQCRVVGAARNRPVLRAAITGAEDDA